MAWNVDRRKMYAHVYFDIPNNTLGVAVYAIGKIPGFSGALGEELKQETQTSKAYDMFLKTLGEGQISKEELQLGKAFTYEEMEAKLKRLDILGKLHAGDSGAQVVVDLDDPMFWFNASLSQLPKDKQQVASRLADDQKKQIGSSLRKQEMEELFTEIQSPDQLQDLLQKLYILISRKINPKVGPKDFPSYSKKQSSPPPAFLISKEHNFAYYPGFRGAQYMTKVPQSLEYIHPQQEADKSLKWYKIIAPDTKQFTDGKSLDTFEIEPLDYITEVLARLFFYNLAGAGEKDLQIMDFNRAVEPVLNKAKDLLQKASQNIKLKTASSQVGKWVDLYTGKIYDSEQEVIEAKKALSESQEERLPLAAQIRLNKLAGLLLSKNRFNIYSELKEILQ